MAEHTTTTAPAPKMTPEKKLSSWVFRALRATREKENTDTTLAMRILRAMGRHFVPGMIFRREANQAMGFCHTPRFPGDIGFQIISADKNRHLTPVEEKRRDQLQDFIMRGGFPWEHPITGQMGCWMGNGVPTYRFPEFMRAIVMNSMTFDAAPVRMEATAGYAAGEGMVRLTKAMGHPAPEPVAAFIPIAGDRVTLTVREEYKPEYRTDVNAKIIEYVVKGPEDQIQFELTWREMAYWVRNRDDRQELQGYGHSELEDAVDVLSGAAMGFKWNTEQFAGNHIPPGFVAMPGGTEEVIEEFLTTLELSSGPAGGWHNLPVIATDPEGKATVQFVPLGERPSDMQQEKFLVFCINVLCSLFCKSAEEIGFQAYTARQGTPLNEADPETRIMQGQDTGFGPRMTWAEANINESIISRFDDGAWRFVWKGLSKSSEERALKLSGLRLMQGITSQEQEQEYCDLLPRKMPNDVELWDRCQREVYAEIPGADDDPETLMAVLQKKYVAAGGTWNLATSIPMSSQASSMFMQISQAGGGGGGMDMGGGEDQWDPGGPGEGPEEPGAAHPHDLEDGVEPEDEQDQGQDGPPMRKGFVARTAERWWPRNQIVITVEE